jgi:diguanylate cyclase (GGDEF)-like protein
VTLLRRYPIAIGIPMVLGIGWIDYLSGPDIGLSILYLVPIAIVAWFGTAEQAAVCALLAGFCWLGADYAWRRELTRTVLWNNFTLVLIQVAGAYLVNRFRRDRDDLRILNLELEHALKREAQIARTDVLTGLPNSRAFLEVLEREVARAKREKGGLCMLFLDVDNFKAVNDYYGHAVGDEVLKKIGNLIVDVVRASDVVARMGGDEFGVLLWHIRKEEATNIADRVRTRVAEFATQYPKARLGVSVGIAWFDEPPEDLDDILRAADREMYEEKAARKAS